MRFFAEFEEGGEACDVVRGVDEWELQVERLDELEVGVSELEDVYLYIMLARTEYMRKGIDVTCKRSEKSMSM